jgi:hypothetical protein
MEAVKSLLDPITPLRRFISKVEEITTEQGKAIVLAVDEAQVLLKTGINKFLTTKEPNKFKRPFYSFFMNQISRLWRPVLIAGTALSLSDLHEYESVFGKIEGIQIIDHRNFRCACEYTNTTLHFLRIDPLSTQRKEEKDMRVVVGCC